MEQPTTDLAPSLRALVALDEHDGYLTGAAAALAIPQSSMSRRIHALEQSLRIPLVTRDGRTVRLTPIARRLAAAMRGPLGEVDAAIAEVTGEADPDHGVVRFGFPLTMGHGSMPDLLAAFNRMYPGIRLELKQAHGAELITDLRRGELDLAVTIPPPDDLPHTIIAAQEICARVPADHRLATRTSIDLTELAGERFIGTPTTYHLRRLTETWCRTAGFHPEVTVEITEFATVEEFVGRGLGVALLPAAERPAGDTVQLHLRGDHRRAVGLCSATARLTPTARRLHEYLTENRLP